MWSFLTGVAGAMVLAGGTYWVLQVGTITVLDQTDTYSTILEDAWGPHSPAGMEAPLDGGL